jgi:hypothetical protein
MQIVTNEPRVKRNRQIATILFFASLAILVGGLAVTNFLIPSESTLVLVPCLVLPFGMLTTVISVRLTNQYVRPPHPEDAIREGVKGIDRRSVLYNYVLPANHVLISPHGIYTFTTRFQDSRFRVEGETWYSWKARGPLAPLFLFLRQEGLGDPFKQARKDAASVQVHVDKALPNAGIKVQPAVVFISPKVELEMIDPAVPVVYGDSKRKPSLKSLLREEKRKDETPMLTTAQIDALEEQILSTLNDNQLENQLVEEV